MESTLQGLNITVVGMGLVFFALAIVMVAIIGLDRLFPGEAQVLPRTEGAASLSPPSAAAAGAPAAPLAAVRFQASVGDKSFVVEAGGASGKVRQFAVGDRVFNVERSKSSIGEILIDGEPHRAEVLGVAGGVARIKIGDQTLEVKLGEATMAAPAARSDAPASVAPTGMAVGRPVPAPLPGKVLRVFVAIGDPVKAGQELCVLEAMKMENSIRALADGVVRHVVVQPGQNVSPGETLMWIE